jgi:hypothetical protein
VIKSTQETQRRENSNTIYTIKMRRHASEKIDPHKQTFIDLEYFVHEFRKKEHYVAIFINANQNDR